uniref:Capsid triplex subunit 2 n=1 Tax=Mastomys natalensis cytomegalovirus 2 TaxID=2973540 RepID=A0A9Y1N689_9BETA|nr:capsid triplex subunit 2 [Mastomys natalensis cytomegalovirus 2]WEG69220.1 capsid triplex subunit 2 [Mastomys natalensis cytomegalovirus 2]WEG69359.1 capsid triplex subunit 2 [Mastomys natalensis cytomegalovirus 2]WEG69497.1 capsid triplex subunit 2 [Mastomys natalensis cytomegalovirus 2]WEG69635.1 capsid triplex subunit 2 [Mastomys natalensis cytomegalovirus 2]
MEPTVFCTFEQRLTTGDVSKLSRMVGAVIPISTRHHLIGSTQVGLDSLIHDKFKDYARLRTRMRDMTLTVLRRVEGNQMILGIPVHGQSYSIRNTGPVLWEKGDVLTALPPIFGGDNISLVSVGGWSLVLPWMVPTQLATEINQRMLLLALLSLDRSREEVRAAFTQLRTLKYRDTTITLPDISIDESVLVDLRNVCISLSMIANISSDVTLTYVRKLALEDSSMLLMKCQEILGRRDQPGDAVALPRGRPQHNITPVEELNKLTTLFVMIRQVMDVISDEPAFLVCDTSPDDKSAVCIFKG